MVKKSRLRIKKKKSQYKRVIKVNKWQNPKSRSERKNQKLLKLETFTANQDYSSTPKLKKSLPN